MNTALKWIIGIVVVAAILVGGYFLFKSQQNNATAATTVQTAQVIRDTIQATVSSNGAVQPNADLSLAFGTSGTVAQVNVKQGQRVKTSDVLATIDDSQLQLAVKQAEASLASAQANLDTTKAGATQKDTTNAQAALDSAKASYNKVKTGNYTAGDIANAKSQLDSAKAKLTQLKAGPTQADITSAKASLDAAGIKLQQAQHGNATTADLASAKAALDVAKIKLSQAVNGNATASDIANAQAALDAAKAKLATVQAGPTQSTMSAAQLKVTDAQASLDKTISQQQTSVDSAKAARDQADNVVRNAQDNLATVYAQTHDDNGNFRSDPANSPNHYEDLYSAAQRTLADAVSSQGKAASAYNDALVQQQTSVKAAQAALDDAKKQLNDTLNPPTHASDLASAQAAVVSAQASLDKLTKGSTSADIQAAQLAVDQAQASYDKLTQGSTALDIKAAQDAVAQAQASYDKLFVSVTPDQIAAAQAAVVSAQVSYDKIVNGGTANDLATAQASVDQAQATLTDLKGGPTQQALSVAMANVEQAQATLDLNKLKLAQAVIIAPFDGVVNAVSIVPGQVLASGTAVELVDDSSYHIDLNVGEADVSKLALGQDVNITFDAVPTATITGKLTFIASKSTVSSNVVSYLTTVTIDSKATASSGVKAGMTANANIVYQSHAGALLVPNRAVKTVGSNKVVTVRSGGVNHDVTVQTDLNDGTYTEITAAGIAEGDTVVLNSATTTTTTNGGGGGRGGFGGGLGGGFGG
jgi:HlyD family secretion protein